MSKNCLSWWFPRIQDTGLPVPLTAIVKTESDLVYLLDNIEPPGFNELVAELAEATRSISGPPWFLRTGVTSGKHGWASTCHVPTVEALPDRIAELVLYSECACLAGLPYDVWVLREMIKTTPLFRCSAYGDFPLVREFRFFATADEVTHVQPYWPPGAVEQGVPDRKDWEDVLAQASVLQPDEREEPGVMAMRAARACGGHWSVDFLQATDGSWWLTDMATAETSYCWDPASGNELY